MRIMHACGAGGFSLYDVTVFAISESPFSHTLISTRAPLCRWAGLFRLSQTSIWLASREESQDSDTPLTQASRQHLAAEKQRPGTRTPSHDISTTYNTTMATTTGPGPIQTHEETRRQARAFRVLTNREQLVWHSLNLNESFAHTCLRFEKEFYGLDPEPVRKLYVDAVWGDKLPDELRLDYKGPRNGAIGRRDQDEDEGGSDDGGDGDGPPGDGGLYDGADEGLDGSVSSPRGPSSPGGPSNGASPGSSSEVGGGTNGFRNGHAMNGRRSTSTQLSHSDWASRANKRKSIDQVISLDTDDDEMAYEDGVSLRASSSASAASPRSPPTQTSRSLARLSSGAGERTKRVRKSLIET